MHGVCPRSLGSSGLDRRHCPGHSSSSSKPTAWTPEDPELTQLLGTQPDPWGAWHKTALRGKSERRYRFWSSGFPWAGPSSQAPGASL